MFKNTKKAIGTGVMLGVGNSVIGAIPGGESIMPAMDKAANMMGPLTTAAMAKDTMDVMQDNMPPKKKQQKQGWGW